MRHSVGLVIVLVASGLPSVRAAEAGASSDGGNALSAVVASRARVTRQAALATRLVVRGMVSVLVMVGLSF
ncbi:MAG: hypothetical protein IH936_09740 [Acidobacteria bacterium]|nr:hypothetical protein [Acidobacteriota bacterium]